MFALYRHIAGSYCLVMRRVIVCAPRHHCRLSVLSSAVMRRRDEARCEYAGDMMSYDTRVARLLR